MHIRAATVSDAALLAEFRCSTGVEYEDEVEVYLHTSAMLDLAHGTDVDDDRLLLLIHDETLVALVWHKQGHSLLLDGDDIEVAHRHLVVVAVSVGWQGEAIDDIRLSDWCLDALTSDLEERDAPAVLTARVHRDNQRSRALMTRLGDVSEHESSDPAYLSVVLVWR